MLVKKNKKIKESLHPIISEKKKDTNDLFQKWLNAVMMVGWAGSPILFVNIFSWKT